LQGVGDAGEEGGGAEIELGHIGDWEVLRRQREVDKTRKGSMEKGGEGKERVGRYVEAAEELRQRRRSLISGISKTNALLWSRQRAETQICGKDSIAALCKTILNQLV
jgi:hypothetical protein